MNNINTDKATLDKILEIVSCIYLAITTTVPVQSSNKDLPVTTTDTVTETNTTDKKVTLEQVRAVLADKSRAGYTEQVRELLQKYGAAKLSGIDPVHYKALVAEAEVLTDGN